MIVLHGSMRPKICTVPEFFLTWIKKRDETEQGMVIIGWDEEVGKIE